MKLFSFDTETFLLKPGLQAPPLVCLQFAYDGAPELVHVRDPACRRIVCEALYDGSIWTGHNIAFDLCVLMAKWPDLVPFIFDLVDQDRATCTIVRQKLLDIARGTFKFMRKRGYDLGSVATRHGLEGIVNKNDPWRLRYSELIDIPISRWDPEPKAYALQDAIAQRAVYKAQTAYARERGFPLVDEYRQARAALWLRLMECQGMRVDAARVEQYIANVKAQLDDDRETCRQAGLIRWEGGKWVKTMAAAMRHMVACCEEDEAEELPLTETGQAECDDKFGGDTWAFWRSVQHKPTGIQLNEDAIVQHGDELLESFQRFATSTTQLSRAERIALAARAGVPIQATFGTLADTGRTTCSQGDRRGQVGPPSALGAQLQNPAKDKLITKKDGTQYLRKGPRELYIFPPGTRGCFTDYGGMELSGWAQACLRHLGHSRLAEVLRAGKDPHTEIGATLAGCEIDEAYARLKGERGAELKAEFKDVHRDLGKRGNFSFQGGAGWRKFKFMVRKNSGVVLEDALAQKIRKAWLATWPEAHDYLNRWVNSQLCEGTEEDRRGTYVHPRSGRMRANMWYSAYANNAFQGYCADIFKDAGWRVAYEMYVGTWHPSFRATKVAETGTELSPLRGGRLVNEVHDELISALPEERAHEAGFRQAEIQTRVGEEWGPDVPWPCEPAFADRWYKAATLVLHPKTKRALAWEPGMKLNKDTTLAGFEDPHTKAFTPWYEGMVIRDGQLVA